MPSRSGRPEVENHHVGVEPRDEVEGALPRRGDLDLHPARLHVDPERPPERHVVVDEQDPGHGAVTALSGAVVPSRTSGCARGTDRTIVSPPPGVSSASRCRAHRLAEAAGDGKPEADAGSGRCVPQPLERHEHPLPVGVVDPRTLVDDAQLQEPVRHDRRAQPDRHGRRGMTHGVLDEIGDGTLEEPGVREHQRQRLVGLVAHRLVRDSAQRLLQHLVEGHRLQDRPHGAGLDAAEVEQVRQQGVEPVGRVGGVVEQGRAVGLRECQCRVLQRRDGGLDAGERRAQVMRHGRDQGRADGVGLAQARRVGSPSGQPVALQDGGRLGRERVEHAAIRGGKGCTGQGHDEAGPGVDGNVGVVDGPGRDVPRDLHHGHAAAVRGSLEERGAAHAERLAGLVEQGLARRCLGRGPLPTGTRGRSPRRDVGPPPGTARHCGRRSWPPPTRRSRR